jgi:hypothetical protein
MTTKFPRSYFPGTSNLAFPSKKAIEGFGSISSAGMLDVCMRRHRGQGKGTALQNKGVGDMTWRGIAAEGF